MAEFSTQGKFYRKKGWAIRKNSPIPNQRFQCNHCNTCFSYMTFKLQYGEKVFGKNSTIFKEHQKGVSVREIGRSIGHSEHMIRERIKKMSRWSLLKQAEVLEDLKLDETIIYDGLENFAGSQYDPNHIQHAVGEDSLFIYDFNFAPLNRKGRMTREQKQRNADIVEKHGKYPPKAIREASKKIFQRLFDKTKLRQLHLHTDEHFQYKRAIEWDLSDLDIVHSTTNSKKARTSRNKLFPVNHTDLLVRKQNAAFSRETISFAKTHIAMIRRYVLFMVWKNFFRPQFVKPSKRRPEANKTTPAMELGLFSRPLKFHDFFDVLPNQKKVKLNSDWKMFLEGVVPFPRKTS